jgi:putative transposase
MAERGTYPRKIVLATGSELTSRFLGQWASDRQVHLRFIDPGTPAQNALSASCTGRLRDECLNRHGFTNVADARRISGGWLTNYNDARPHSSLGYCPPTQCRGEVSLKVTG